MEIEILIDKLTPCLIEKSTGRVFNTNFSIATARELEVAKDWLFNWTNLDDKEANIYKLTLEDDSEIQGLIATRVQKGSVYIELVETAPQNRGDNQKYEGVGGHLFAIAIELSLANGFGGFVHMDAKNEELVEHYKNQLGAIHIGGVHQFRCIIDEPAALKIHKKYTMEGEL